MANTAPRSIRVPDDLWIAAVAKAKAEGTTVTDVILEALRGFVATPVAEVATTAPAPAAVEPGQVVTGRKFGGKQRLTVQVTGVDPEVGMVFGLVAYASTFTPGGTYEGAFRGWTALDASTVTVADQG